MVTRFIFDFLSARRRGTMRRAQVLLLCLTLLPVISLTANGTEPVDPPKAGDPSAHASADRTGALETRDGLTLRVITDLGSVRIVPLEPGAAPAVRYSVHIETDARAP